jgi:hypothetical protein
MSKNKYQNQTKSSQPASQPKSQKSQVTEQAKRPSVSPVRKLDSRYFSRKAYEALKAMATDENDPYYLKEKYHNKASGLIQGLTAYISTWGLHRLSGDVNKFLHNERTSEDTKYKGKVYKKFLENLKEISQHDFNVDSDKRLNEADLIHLPLKEYTALNRLAIRLANEWSFWASSILGEPDEND